MSKWEINDSEEKQTIKLSMPSFEDLDTPPGLEDFFMVNASGVMINSFFTMTLEYPDDFPEEDKIGKAKDEHNAPVGVNFPDDVKEWFKNQATGKIYAGGFGKLFFEKEKDAVLFKLTWC